MDNLVSCPVCEREYEKSVIAEHVDKCLFLNVPETSKPHKRTMPELSVSSRSNVKKPKIESKRISPKQNEEHESASSKSNFTSKENKMKEEKRIPLAEFMRPHYLEDIVGQNTALGPGSMIRSMLEQSKIPNMILWGPPGCGKTSLANVVANICKEHNNLRFVKLSATMAGIGDVKEVVKVAKNELQFKRQTVLFMDEIHRFNKLQQDTFLPHVENGTIVLIGATTENPSFSLNNALLSRCRVIVMDKLSVDDITVILERAVKKNKQLIRILENNKPSDELNHEQPEFLIEKASLQWLAEVCDGDARVALAALELALAAKQPGQNSQETSPATLTLDDVKDGIKRSHTLYDRRGEEHYNTISALHKSVRAGDANAALYWCVRMLHCGEDPLYIMRRLVRTAAEDIGLADTSALTDAVACLQGCQHLGMPECDLLVAQCAVRLAQARKSRALNDAVGRVRRALEDARGPLPSVPLHLRNAPTKLMKTIGYGRGYNLQSKEESGLTYMPEGMEHVNFFEE